MAASYEPIGYINVYGATRAHLRAPEGHRTGPTSRPPAPIQTLCGIGIVGARGETRGFDTASGPLCATCIRIAAYYATKETAA